MQHKKRAVIYVTAQREKMKTRTANNGIIPTYATIAMKISLLAKRKGNEMIGRYRTPEESAHEELRENIMQSAGTVDRMYAILNEIIHIADACNIPCKDTIKERAAQLAQVSYACGYLDGRKSARRTV